MQDIHLKDIKKDQVFFERADYSAGMLKVIALEDAYESGTVKGDNGPLKQWRCKARLYHAVAGVDDNEVIDYLTTENCEHYGPKLYVSSEPIEKPEYKVTKISPLSEIGAETLVLGSLVTEPEVGGSLILVDQDGLLFRTSKIVKIEEINGARVIETKNSKYKLEKI